MPREDQRTNLRIGFPVRRALLGAVLSAPFVLRSATAQGEWPTRAIRLICPYAAGGAADTVVRLLQPGLSATLNTPVVVENRSGGASTIGAIAVARSVPDGYTLLADGAAHAVAQLLVPDLPIDYPTAFLPIGQMTTQPFIWMVASRFPASDLSTFVDIVRQRAEAQPYASASVGSTGHLVGEAFRRAAGLNLEHVSYRGGAEVARDVASGTLEVACTTAASAIPLAANGRARLLATSIAQRIAALPDVPSFAESGFPEIDIGSWVSLFAPAGTSAGIVQRVNAAMQQTLESETLRQRLLAAGFEPTGSSPEALAELLLRERDVLGRLIREAGIGRG